MANINGYFKLFRDEKGTSIRIFPPGEGGEPVSYDEVINYLTENKFENVDVASINRAVEEGKTAIKEAIVTLTPGYPVNERMIVRYEEDNMVAVARFYPASNDGKDIDKDEIMSDISFAGIKYGIKEEAVDSFLNDRQYCKDYIIYLTPFCQIFLCLDLTVRIRTTSYQRAIVLRIHIPRLITIHIQ